MCDENIAIAEKNIAAYQPFEFLKRRRPPPPPGCGDAPAVAAVAADGEAGADATARRGRRRGRVADAAVELEQFERQIVRYNKAAAKVLSVPAGFRATRLTELDCEALNHELANAAIAHAKGCLDAVAHGVVADVSAMNKESRATVVRLSKKPGNTDELVAAEAYLEHVQGVELPALSRQLAHIQAKVTFLFSHNALSQDVLDFFRSTFISVRDVNEQLTRGGDVLGAERSVIEAELKKHIVEFGEYLDEVGAQVRMFRDKGNPKLIREYIEQVNEVSARLEAAQTQAGEINAEEAKLSMSATFFRQFDEMDAELTPYRQLWSTALSFHQAYSTWVKGHILTLDGEQISRDHAEMLGSSRRSRRGSRPTAPTSRCASRSRSCSSSSASACRVPVVRRPDRTCARATGRRSPASSASALAREHHEPHQPHRAERHVEGQGRAARRRRRARRRRGARRGDTR